MEVKDSLNNKLRPDKPYRLTNDPKMTKIMPDAKPTASRETVRQVEMAYQDAFRRLGGDDGSQVTLAQIKDYLGTTLRFTEVSGGSLKVPEVLQRAQDLTTLGGRVAALTVLDSDFKFFRSISDMLKAGKLDDYGKALPENIKDDLIKLLSSPPNMQTHKAREVQRNVTALEASKDLLYREMSQSRLPT